MGAVTVGQVAADQGLNAPARPVAGVSSGSKWQAAGFSIVLILVVLSPVIENWREDPSDSFPLSYYPMFSYERSGTQRLSYLVGTTSRGDRVSIPYTLAGTGGMNQVRRQIEKIVSRNEAAQLCQTVAARVAQRRTGPLAGVSQVDVVTGTFDLGEYFTSTTAPQSERVRASCSVARRS